MIRFCILSLVSNFIGMVAASHSISANHFKGLHLGVLGGVGILNTSCTIYEQATQHSNRLYWAKNKSMTQEKIFLGMQTGYTWEMNPWITGLSFYGTYHPFSLKIHDSTPGITQKASSALSHTFSLGTLAEGGLRVGPCAILGKAGLEGGLFSLQTAFSGSQYKNDDYKDDSAAFFKIAPVVGLSIEWIIHTEAHRYKVGLHHLSSFFNGLEKTFSSKTVARTFTQKSGRVYKGSLFASLSLVW